jgi:hypothetical protein
MSAPPSRNPVSRAWSFWTKPIRAEPLALFRIVLGVVGIASLLISMVPVLDLYGAPDGLLPVEGMDDWLRRSHRFSVLRGPVNLLGLERMLPADVVRAWAAWGASRAGLWTVLVALLVALTALTVGLWTRLACIAAWFLATSLNNRLPWILNGGDAMFQEGLFYLMLSPAGAAWSLDRLRRCRRSGRVFTEPVWIAPWSVRLIQIQLCLVYFQTGLGMVADALVDGDWRNNDWIDGIALYWVMNDTTLTRWPYQWLPVPVGLCRILTRITLIWEVLFCLLVWCSWTRKWVLGLGVVLHLGIWLTLEVGWFSPFTLCWYAVFLTAAEVERLVGTSGERGSSSPC